MSLFGTMAVEGNELTIGGVAVSELKEEFGTPLYIIDEANVKRQAKVFIDNFQSEQFDTHVIYASKAFINLYMAELVDQSGLHIDVVSGGELFTVLEADFPAEKVYFHGNNKLPRELTYAIQENVGCIIVDNVKEYERISHIAAEQEKVQRVLLRVNPGIEADTHKYIQTTKEDSKFGISTNHPELNNFISRMVADENIQFDGFHCHIGSQVIDGKFFFEEAEVMIAFAKETADQHAIDIHELNLGGGFGVRHLQDEETLDYVEFLQNYIGKIEAALTKNELSVQTISIEPGRSLINSSGSTLYTVGSVKETGSGYPFIFIDGGMSDNLRPSLYEAKYDAVVANKMTEADAETYRIAGKLCETGDILIQEVDLPKVESEDLILVPATGAYTFSMSSQYNLVERPAVVFVENREAHLAVKRDSFADLIRNQIKKSDT